MTGKKRKLRKIKIHRKKTGPKRHIRKSFVVLFLVAVIGICSILFVPGMITSSQLRDLGYSNEAVKAIEEEKLSDTILKNKYYSEYLEQCIIDGSLEQDYISLYAAVSKDRGLTESDLLLYSRLEDKGYEEDQLLNLYENLKFYELTPLLIFDYQWDETKYIADCQAHAEENSETHFVLSGSYYTPYKITTEMNAKSDEINILINKGHYFTEDYAPSDLVSIDTQYSVTGMQLKDEAEKQFILLSKAGVTANHNFYASTTYRDYSTSDTVYQYCVLAVGSSNADNSCSRAGYSEHQTGLAVNVTCTYEDGTDFATTEVYAWLKENMAMYGFIERYPSGKESITGMEAEPNHLRYVGKELAQAFNTTNLTYDEYYALYLADWDDDTYKPSKHIILAADPANQK